MASRSESRQKTELVQVRCTPEEKAQLKARAAVFGVSVGELCRQSIFNAVPKSKTDLNAIQELAATRADLGRLGGLFKGWLTGAFEEVAPPGPKTTAEIGRILREIDATKNKVDAIVDRVGLPK